ncbi:hypothetical protein F5Y19DRAFT_95663 [Xylariaceae sp. FL1651]|nr:hypothetical protein F5Y19DRAFT_95663 [Xylariaceae sp. FL1651]
MCVKSYQQFAKCDHVSTTLTTCPTYHKEQSTAKGFFGSLFRRNIKKKKHCGKVVPYHCQDAVGFCQACTIKTDRLRAWEIGQGALRVQRQAVEESFRDERQKAAKHSLQKSERHRHYGKVSNHNVIHVQSSVWLDDLYYHPETLARKEAYARAAAQAPRVSSRPPQESYPCTTKPNTRGRTREDCKEKPYPAQRRGPQTPSQQMPVFGGSQPLPRPAQPEPTYQYPGRFMHGAPGLPPAVGLPPRSRRDSQPSTQATPARPPTAKLRHKKGRVYNNTKSHNQPTVPAYQVYLEGMTTQAMLRTTREAGMPAKSRQISSRTIETGTEPRRAYWTTQPSHGISGFFDRINGSPRKLFADESSDVSFVCESARQISEQSRSSGARRGARK